MGLPWQADRAGAPLAADFAGPDELGDFAEFVETHVSPYTWQHLGGCGTARLYHGLLVVCHDVRIHREVAALLDTLSEATRQLQPVERLVRDGNADGVRSLLDAEASQSDRRVREYLVFLLLHQLEATGVSQEPLLLDRLRQTADRWQEDDDSEIYEAGIQLRHLLLQKHGEGE
jgi:hypothetical protein